MRLKFDPRAMAIPMPGRHGKYLVMRQYNSGGCTFADNNNGKGYSLEDATYFAAQFNSKGKRNANYER